MSYYEQRPPNAPCPTGDELLDQQAMRDFLLDAWNNSNASATPSNRREQPGYLFEDSTGSLVYRLYPDHATDTPCSSAGTPVGTLPGIPLAIGHTHPFTPGDTLPLNCSNPPLPPGTFALYDVKKYGGPSPADIQRVANDSVPAYIVDRLNVYLVPLGTTKKNAKSNTKPYPRVDPVTGCVRVSVAP